MLNQYSRGCLTTAGSGQSCALPLMLSVIPLQIRGVMMEFLLIAYDGKDPGAKDRRLRAREAHLQGVKRMIEEGTFISGGAILDDGGNMIGSTLYLDFKDRSELEHWLRNDPYTTGEVWTDVQIHPIRLVFRK
jgi:uncharacterized protein